MSSQEAQCDVYAEVMAGQDAKKRMPNRTNIFFIGNLLNL